MDRRPVFPIQRKGSCTSWVAADVMQRADIVCPDRSPRSALRDEHGDLLGARALRSYADTGNVPSLHQVRRILQGYTAKGTVYCGLPEKCPAWWTRRSSTNPPARVSLPVRRRSLPGVDGRPRRRRRTPLAGVAVCGTRAANISAKRSRGGNLDGVRRIRRKERFYQRSIAAIRGC